MKPALKTSQPVIIQKLYDLLVWISPIISKFPKDKRYTIGTRIESQFLDILEMLVEAVYSTEKMEFLKHANIELEKLRFLIRLAKDLRFIDLHRYGYIVEHVDEVGWERGHLARIKTSWLFKIISMKTHH